MPFVTETRRTWRSNFISAAGADQVRKYPLLFGMKDEALTAVLYPTVVNSPVSHNQRGIQLMRMFMDEVHFEHGGREVRMRKRLPPCTNRHAIPLPRLAACL